MVTIEINTETAAEMITLLDRMKGQEGCNHGREPVHTMQEEGNVRSCRKDPLPCVEGLAEAPQKEDGENNPDSFIGEIIEDLRYYAKFVDGMPLPADMQNNILRAARIIEIMWKYREIHQTVDVSEIDSICEAMG